MRITLAAIAEQVQLIPEHAKWPLDGLAIVGWITALFGMLTGVVAFIAGVLSMAWCAIRLYETKTVQEWLKKRRSK